jgi:LCP family protein required for cell wall assembly
MTDEPTPATGTSPEPELDAAPATRERSAPASRLGHPHVRRTFLLVTALVSALVAIVAATGMGLYRYAQAQQRYIGDEGPIAVASGVSPTPPPITGKCAQKECNYLLLGSDSREGLTKEQQVQFGTDQDIGGANRSDTIMVVHIDPDQKQATFLSFPRDLWVNIPGQGYNKINAAFEAGINGTGAWDVARTITSFTGIRIDHVMYVDLAGFEGVVNALGGVDMCVPYPMVDPLTALDIPAGCQHFDGRTALAYVRTRHQPCDKIPDFARITRQQQFLRSVLSKVLSPGEILQLPKLIRPVLRSIVVDRGLNPAELAYLAGQLEGVTSGNADFRVVPTTPGWEGSLSVVHLVQPDADQLFEAIRTGSPIGELGQAQESTAPSPAVITAAVYARGVHGLPSPSSLPSASVSPSASPSPSPGGMSPSPPASPGASPSPGALPSAGQADAASTVHDVLTKAGFDTSIPMQPLSALEGEVPFTGTVILYNPASAEGQAMADVVRGYLSNVDVQPAPRHLLPKGVDVAVVVAPGYELPPPSSAPPVDCTTT